MAYASRSGRAHTDSSNPEAFGVCDRCGIWENFRNLHWQYEWAGTHLYNKYLLFCESCLDIPQEQLRTLILPPDPLPIQYARVEAFAADEAGPVQSMLSAYAPLGSSVLSLQSVTGFASDQNILVQMNNGIFAAEEILSVDPIGVTITVSIPLPYSASIDNLVTVANL